MKKIFSYLFLHYLLYIAMLTIYSSMGFIIMPILMT